MELRVPRAAVWHCEEFHAGEPRAPAVHAQRLPVSAEPLSPGLCANCEHRAGCTLPKSAGGVWHCEEYQ